MKLNRWKIATLALTGIVVSFLSIYVYLTPYLALRNIRQAFIEKDAETVIAHIDFPVFKENFKAELNAKMASEMAKNVEKDKNNPFTGLGAMFAATVVNNIVDTFISAPAVERFVKGEFTPLEQGVSQLAPDSNPFKNVLINEEKVTVESRYRSFNEFAVDTANKAEPTKGVTLIFQRRGMISWQLTNMKLK